MALISAVVMIAVIGATTADFAYDARVDLAAATNARDELKAHYLARSAMSLSQLLLNIQNNLIGPNQQFFGMEIELADYASLLMSIFSSEGGAAMVGSMLGIDSSEIKGLGIDEGFFDATMVSLDGKLNINCAGGPNPGAAAVTRMAAGLTALLMPERYNRLFEEPRPDGQFIDRLQVTQAIIDWADQDTMRFGTGGVEDYRYDTGPDPYEIKDQYFDTMEEVRLVYGVNDAFIDAFGRALTVYGPCKVNLSLVEAPVVAALILQFAKSPSDPGLRFDNLMLLARLVVQIRELSGQFKDANAFVKAVEDPVAQMGMAQSMDSIVGQMMGVNNQQEMSGLPHVTGVELDAEKLQEAVSTGGEKRIWQIEATAEVGRIKKTITGIWDTKLVSQNRQRTPGRGGLVYWREE